VFSREIRNALSCQEVPQRLKPIIFAGHTADLRPSKPKSGLPGAPEGLLHAVVGDSKVGKMFSQSHPSQIGGSATLTSSGLKFFAADKRRSEKNWPRIYAKKRESDFLPQISADKRRSRRK
jgi:hypothetical protein